jgi:hypothetical protein
MLDQPALAAALQATFESMPAAAADAADALANDYATYASAATFGASQLEVSEAVATAMGDTLFAAISVPASGLPATFAAAWAAAVAAFWVGLPVVGAQSGATAGCPGAASIAATLTAVFANLANSAGVCAVALAAALHGATLTVTATVAPPAGTVLPIA